MALQSRVLKSCSVSSQNLTYEIILTLGQAFEVAYQLALQAQKSRPMGASAAETVETKSSKPVPKPRVGVRKSAVRGPRPPRTPPSPGFEGLGGGGSRRVFSHCGRPAGPLGKHRYFLSREVDSCPPATGFCPLPCQAPPGPSRWPAWGGCRERVPQRAPSNVTLCLCLLCSAPQVPLPPDSRCCYCHTCTTHRPSYLPLPSVSPGVKVFTAPAVCVSVSPK